MEKRNELGMDSTEMYRYNELMQQGRLFDATMYRQKCFENHKKLERLHKAWSKLK